MASLVVVSIGGMIVDGRVRTGLPIRAKSVKFALATLIYAVTWAWLAPLGVLAYLLIRSLRAPRPVPEPRTET